MSAETRKVLEMLVEEKINFEDAERLLDKLASTRPNENPVNDTTTARPPSAAKFLRVKVDTGEGDDVNVKVPLSFLRSGVRLVGMLPKPIAEKLSEKGVNLEFLSSLKGEDLDEALNALHVDVETGEGDHVQVFCE